MIKVNVETTRDPLMLAYWERVLNGLVYDLYFPEALDAAGLRLFDLVAQAKLPDLEGVGGAASPSSREEGAASPSHQGQAGPATAKGRAALDTLRQKFEELHPALRDAHPVRIALDKLQTIDTIRVIEGKT
jgi:hypothetical protein